MNAFMQTIQFYAQEGYQIKTGLNPYHFSMEKNFISDYVTYLPFTSIFKDSIKQELLTGGGVSTNEVFLFDTLSSLNLNIQNIFIIGNAFGFSSVLFSLLFPQAKVIALDAGCEGKDNLLGIDLTNKIASKHNLNLYVELGYSPQDTNKVIHKHFSNQKLDLIFIDGLHTNQQLLLDFQEVFKYAHNETIYFLHDVINYKMQESFQVIKQTLQSSHITNILYRTQSGMGISVPKNHNDLMFFVNCFTEKQETIEHLQKIAHNYKYLKLKRKLAKILPKKFKVIIKKMLRI